tara:strand:- start:509 stop:1441 length:933 start_codon:yes stop_codon:yes gene_type:complete
MKKNISIVTNCFNEEANVTALYQAVKSIMEKQDKYNYEHIFIDNNSYDKTLAILKEIAGNDKNIKIISNSRNFGQIRSGVYGILQATGDAVIHIVADFQDPPDMIETFLESWDNGYKVVVGVKKSSEESPIIGSIRKFYYFLIGKISDTKLIKNFTGFGLYDKSFINIIRELDDPYPYFRGLISEIGFEPKKIEYVQPKRKKGKSNHTFYTLYDFAILGITSHSKIPLRLIIFSGFFISFLCFLIGLGYLIYKLIYWDRFDVGIAPVVIGIFFFASIQLFFMGILGEYIGFIHTQLLKRPMVVEKERINF